LKAHPELRKLYGHSYLTSAVIVGIVAVQLFCAWLVQRGVLEGTWAGSLWFIIPLAYFVGGTLNHWAGMGMHEASHDLAAATELENRLIAIFANIPIVAPAAMSFRRYHMKHHTHLGIMPEDNDLAMRFEIDWVGRSSVRKLIWLFFYLLFATLARGFVRKLERWELVNIVFTLLVDAAIVHYLGWSALGYLALSTFLGYGLHPAAAHFIHEHYVWKRGQETYSYYGPLNWVTFNVGYHNEHHDLMWIPGWKLPLIKRTAPEFYDGLVTHRSWTWVLLHFIVNPRMGHDMRITRSRATMKRKSTEIRIASRDVGSPAPARAAEALA
jgi:sphingolipid delta-4 desaturase